MQRKSFLMIGIVLGLLLFQAAAMADIQVAGNTTGSYFNGGGTTVHDLTFTGNSFGPFTIPTGGSQGSFQIGQFYLGSDFWQDYDETLHLRVDFTLPTGITGGLDPYTFTADITGGVHLYSGAIAVAFDQWSQPFHFDNGAVNGNFTFNIEGRGSDNDIDVPMHSNTNLTANISGVTFANDVAPVPEPTSVLLLSTVVVGLGLFYRRKLA